MTKNIFISSLAVIFSSILFVFNDAIINFIAPLNIKFYHFVFYGSPAYLSIPIYLLITKKFREKMFATNYFIPLLRSLIFLPLPYMTFISLKNISLPEYTTLNMSAPFFAGIFAVFYLKEKLNIYIFISLILGFLGVLFVIQPGFENFSIYFLVTLFGAFLITLTTVLINKFNYVTSTLGYFVYGGVFVHLISFFLFLYDPLKINFKIFIMITSASIFINFAIFLNVFAFKYSQKYYASVFCLVYLQIVWSSIVGMIFFSEYLDNIALIGAIFIILSGIISIPGQLKQVNE